MSGSNVLLKSAFLIVSMAYSIGGEMADYSLCTTAVNREMLVMQLHATLSSSTYTFYSLPATRPGSCRHNETPVGEAIRGIGSTTSRIEADVPYEIMGIFVREYIAR